MNPETRPQQQLPSPEPSQDLTAEMSFATAVRQAVDDLFTGQAIAGKLQEMPADEAMMAMLQAWKQDLTHQLSDMAQTMVHNVVATIDLIQSGARPSLSEIERQEWAKIERWHTPFIVASICREDLRGILSNEEIAALDDSDMARIADKMSDAYRDSGGYWESLEIMANSVLAKRQASEMVETNEANADDLEPPSLETLMQWEAEDGCEAACPHGCWVEPDGVCSHGNESWLLRLGLI